MADAATAMRSARAGWSGLPLPLLIVARAVRVALWTAFAAPALLTLRLWGKESGARVLRWYLESLGATFVKLGQLLAMRYDLLPSAYCEELSKLLGNVPAIDAKRVISVIESELEQPIDELFAHFSAQPLAAASIAQIHQARLDTGETVAVKVMRPGIERLFRVDFLFLRFLARLLALTGLLSHRELRGVVRELIQATREELDFRREARNLEQMHELMTSDEIDHYAPWVDPRRSTGRVITMEKLEGVSVTDLLAAVGADDSERLDAWAERGITPEAVARNLLHSLLVQTMRHRLFQADPHTANMIAMDGGTLGWVDLGMLGWLDERAWAVQFKMRMAIAGERIDDAYQALLASLETPYRPSSHFEAEVKGYLRDWLVAARRSSATLEEKSAGFFFLRTFTSIRRERLRVPTGAMRLYRAIIVADIVMLKLAPELDWVPLLRELIDAERQHQAASALSEIGDLAELGSAVQAAAASPKMAFELLEAAHGRLARTAAPTRSGTERAAALALGWLRTALLLTLLAVVAGWSLAPELLPAGVAALGTAARWGGGAATLAAVRLLGRLISELSGED